MRVNKSLGKRLLIATGPLAAMLLAFGGCADYATVGVGYSNAYYVPDYRPFYGAYFYDGYPWWGSGPYVVNKYVVKDVYKRINVNRNVYYGRHHFMGNAWMRGGGGRFNIRPHGRHHI
jgi:hypothetical protein